ncbi:MAG: carboxymuconolactone decarboxylase family protein [Gammaproteobacteria bacterium]
MTDATAEDRRRNGRQLYTEMFDAERLRRQDASRNDFNGPLRDYVMETCFGNIWDRPGLERKTRSLLCIAMLTALRLPNETRSHVNSALNNGCTVDELREAIMHTAPYCGLPATGQTMAVAEEVLRERALL